MRRPLAFAFLASLVTTAAAARAPPIDSIDVRRSGVDLVITWSPPATPVDGYRVYRSRTPDCSGEELVYEGTDAAYTDPGAIESPEPALYRIAAFVGGEEGPRTTPAYLYRPPLGPFAGTIHERSYATPYRFPATNSLDLCTELNHGDRMGSPLAAHGSPSRRALRTKPATAEAPSPGSRSCPARRTC